MRKFTERNSRDLLWRSAKSPLGLLGWFVVLFKPIRAVIDWLGNLDLVETYLPRIGAFLNSGWGTASTVIFGALIVGSALHRVGTQQANAEDIESKTVPNQNGGNGSKLRVVEQWFSPLEAAGRFVDPKLIKINNDLWDKKKETEAAMYAALQKYIGVQNSSFTNALSVTPLPDAQSLSKAYSAASTAAMEASRASKDAERAVLNHLSYMLSQGILMASGFLKPKNPGDLEVNITPAEWRILEIDLEKATAKTETYEYIGLAVGKPVDAARR